MAAIRLLVLLSALGSHSVAAETVYYDCDTPGAKYSEIKVGRDGSSYRVRGAIMPMEVRPARGWVPTATVFVQSSLNKDYAAIQLMNVSGKTFAATIDVTAGGSKQKTSLGVTKLNDKVWFDIYLPEEGDGFVKFAGRTVPVKVRFGQEAKVSITCSSGHFRFDPLDWNWQRNP